MNKLEALGNKIRELRERKNWSLDRLSEELEKEDIDIVPSTLFRIEKGQRKNRYSPSPWSFQNFKL